MTRDIDVASVDFESFYSAHAEAMAGSLAMILGDAAVASDAVTEAMTKAWQRWADVARYSNPRGWTFTVALNVGRRRMGRRSREPLFAEVDGPGHEDEHDAVTLSMLGALTPDQRAIIVLRVLDRYSTAETADVLGVAEGTVKSRLKRALDILRADTGSQP